MAGSNKSNSGKARKRKQQLQAKARVTSAERPGKRPYERGASRTGFRA